MAHAVVASPDQECPRSLAPCQACADGSVACPWARCEGGTCAAGIDQCPGTNPCADSACGDPCSLCEPGEPCLPVAMFCNAELKCQLNEPTCATNACDTDVDCPGVGVCPPCPDGNSCAELKCVDGWAYRTESPNTRHIGPMAQDFMAAFEVGSSDLTILQIDADGVAFAAIQALNTRLKAVEERNQQLQRELAKQSQRCEH